MRSENGLSPSPTALDELNSSERGGRMKQDSSRVEQVRKPVRYAGSGLAVGAGLGMIFDVMLFQNLALGSAIGASVRPATGAAMRTKRR